MASFNSSSLQKLVQSLRTIERNYFLVAMVLLLIISLVSFSNKRGPLIELCDYGEHAASIRELSTRLHSPRNPLLAADGSTTLRYTPYIFLLALVKKIFPCDLLTLIGLASIVSFLFLIVGVYVWSTEYFRDRKVAVYVLGALLFLWGKSFNYSNEYSLSFLSYTLFYPSLIAFNMSFLGFYFVLSYSRYGQWGNYVLYLILASFIFLVHSLTGSFFLICSFLLIVIESNNKPRNVGLYILSLLAIAFCSMLWPYYSFIDAVIKSTTTDWYYPFRMYLYEVGNIYSIGPALLGLPIILFFTMRKRYAFICAGFLACSAVYVLSYFGNIRLGERYIFFIMFFFHLSLGWYLSTLEILSLNVRKVLVNLSGKNINLLFFSLIVFFGILYQVGKLGFEQAGYQLTFKPMPSITKYKNPLNQYMLLAGKMGEGDVVMTDPLTGWLLPAFTGAKIISLYHNNPLVPDNDQRIGDTITFYSATTSLEGRKAILQKYGATKVLLNFDRMEENEINQISNSRENYSIDRRLTDDLLKMGKITFESDNLMLFLLH